MTCSESTLLLANNKQSPTQQTA
uniref:Uncharacterized protein n=1 Tax=Arundo donax TaxID=35708 RepID=A0A0A9AC03_ARUDO